MVSILLDYKVIECDNGHINECVRKECKVCGESFHEFDFPSDPYVDMRIVRLESTLKLIEENEKKLKTIKKEYRKGIIVKKECEDYNLFMRESISSLSVLTEMNVFNELDLRNDNLEHQDVEVRVNLIVQYLEGLYELIYKLLSIEPDSLRNNIFKRIIKTTTSVKDSSIQLIFSTTAKSYDESKQLEADAQEKLNIATSEMNILGSIFGAENIMNNFEIYSNGSINLSVIIGMITSNNTEGGIKENLQNVKESTYYYFKDLFEKPIDYYSDEEMLNLSIFRFMGISVFNDENYFRKIQVSLSMLNRAYEKNPSKLLQFAREYINKYTYMMTKIQELSISFAFVFGNNPTDLIIIHNSIKWYKDLCEGIYRDTSKIILYCCDILSNSNTDIEKVLEWTGFAEITGKFNDQKKYNLHLLTEGIEKIIRNSEAHVEYDIDDDSKKITLRNKETKQMVIDTKEYSYENFLEVMNLLAETVFSMIASINIFLSNNKETFADIKNDIEYRLNESAKSISADIIFPLKSVIITNKEEKNIDDINCLILSGTYLGDETIDIFEGLISLFAPLSGSYPECQIIKLFLSDSNNNRIGSILVRTEYFKVWSEAKWKDYVLWLAVETTEINYVDGQPTDPISKDFEFLFGVLKLLMPRFDEMNKSKLKLIENFDKYISVFHDFSEEFDFVSYSLQEYLKYSYDRRFVNHVIDIIKVISENLKQIIRESILDERSNKWFKNIGYELSRISELSQLFQGDVNKDDFFRTKTREGVNLYKNLGLNDRCPCGSGKKYKKCCR